jgi:hypothetical protein
MSEEGIRRPFWRLVGLVAGAIALAWSASSGRAGTDARPASAAEVQRSWHERLKGRHFTAHITIEMNLGGMDENRELVVYRDDEASKERLMIRFESPPDLHGSALLYLEQQDRPNDYFIYQNSARRVRRVPKVAVDEDVYGIDLEFLGFGVSKVMPTRVDSMKLESVNGRQAYRLEETPLAENVHFDHRVTWIDSSTFVPLRTEQRLKGELVLVAETNEIRDIQGLPTPAKMHFEVIKGKRSIMLSVRDVDYQQPIPDSAFSIINMASRQER